MRAKIERLNDTGEGIAVIDEKIVFIPKAIPGDIVTIKNVEEHKNYIRANINKIIKKSDIQREIKCPYYYECGGCQIMNMDYKEQLNYKKNKVISIFKKYGNINIIPQIYSDKEFKYRNKIILEVRNGVMGLCKYHSHDIIKVDNCLLVSDNINEIIKLINNNLDLSLVNRIMIRESTSNDIMVVIYGKIDIDNVKSVLKDKISSLYLNNKLILGNKNIKTKLNKYIYTVSPNSFFQINHNMTIKLYDKILEYLNNSDNVLDLYCGTGSIGIYISKKTKAILGVEIVEDAIANANINKKINKIDNIYFKCGDVAKLINSNDKYDAIIVDPPRAGLSKRTKDILLDINSKKIIYVSCNPMTLLRDIKFLNSNYNLKEINLFDLFPNTYHVESICILERRNI